MFQNIVIILRMIKFSHTVFALPFAIIAAFLAGPGGEPGFCGWQKLLLIVLCMVFARSTAMTFNRIVDMRFDAANPRTANRAIPAGLLSVKKAWIFLYCCAFLFGATTFLFWKPLGAWFGFGNFWPALLAPPVLLFICLYSFTKRFTWVSHFWLGAALMFAPVGAYAAISPPDGPLTSLSAWVLGAAVLLWTAGFDIIYACQDIDIDRRDGLHSLPAKLGMAPALWVSRMCHSLVITLLLYLALLAPLGAIYLAAVAVTGGLLLVEHVLVWRGDMNRIKLAFGTINGLISILLALATVLDVLWP